MRALASHLRDLGSILGLVNICGLTLLLVLVHAPRGFPPGTAVTLVSPSPQKPINISIWISVSRPEDRDYNKVSYFILIILSKDVVRSTVDHQ